MANAHRAVGRWRLPAILFLAYAVSMADRSLVAAAGDPIKRSLALSDFQFGLLSGPAFAVLFCLCGLPLGWLADRVDNRAMIAAGLVSWSAMTAFCGLAHSYGELVLARIGVGIGEACLLPAGMAWMKSHMPPTQIGKGVAIFLMGSSVGSALAHLAGGYLLLRLPGPGSAVLHLSGSDVWRALFLLAGLFGLGVAVLVWLGPASAPTSAHAPLTHIRAVARHLWDERRAYVPLTAATCCTLALSQATAAWLPLYYAREYGLTPGQSAFSVGVLVLASAPLGQALGGWCIDTCRHRGATAPPNFVLALCTALAIVPAMAFCLSGSLRCSQAAYLVFGVLSAAATPCGLAGWQSLAPAAYTGQVVAVLVAVVTLLGLGPVVIGFLTEDVFGNERALGRAIMALCLVTSTLGCLFALAGSAAFRDSLERGPTTRATHAPAQGRRIRCAVPVPGSSPRY